eukprot:3228087-Rhodomonas_salina.2
MSRYALSSAWCYALSGTDSAYGAMRYPILTPPYLQPTSNPPPPRRLLRTADPRPSTDPELYAYLRAMRCPVLTRRMVQQGPTASVHRLSYQGAEYLDAALKPGTTRPMLLRIWYYGPTHMVL